MFAVDLYPDRGAKRTRMYTTRQNSDMTVVCGYDKHQVHKCVLSLWSDYFKRGANGEFEVCISQRAHFI